jgi:hypothetical protein
MEKLKKCSVCGEEKLATNEYFHNYARSKDGLKSMCKECMKEYNKKNHAQYYEKNKEKVNTKNMENYFKKHPKVEKEVIPDGYKRCSQCGELKPKTTEYFGVEKKTKDGFKFSCKACRREIEYLANYEHNRKKQKDWYENNKSTTLLKQKVYIAKNIDIKRTRDKIYYQKNKVQIKKDVKMRFYKRIEEDAGFKILQRCRKRLWEAVKNHSKAARTQELIGCTTDELLKHLESQFTDGMTIENYGEWHVDHRRPCATFDFSKEEDQRECFHYTNLQPLWAEDNMRKSAKYETPL